MSTAEYPPSFTVALPTYNRAELLPKVFGSLQRQTFRDFEVVVINDGSTDSTAEYLDQVQDGMSFRVQTIHQSNAGRSAALNRAFPHARGELFLIMDDDDQLLPDALEKLWRQWQSIPASRRSGFCGVAGLCIGADNAVLGSRFPEDPLDSDFFTMRYRLNVRGDKKEAVRSDLVRDFQFKLFPGERRVPTSALWYWLARRFQTRFFNGVCAMKGYRDDGMTNNLSGIIRASSRSMEQYYSDLLRGFPDADRSVRASLMRELQTISLRLGRPALKMWWEGPDRWLGLRVLPGSLRDRRRASSAPTSLK